MVAFLTAGCFKCETFLNCLHISLEKKIKIILVHDPKSCPFPQPYEVPEFLKTSNVFDAIAITFLEAYATECWKEIQGKFSKPDISGNSTDVAVDNQVKSMCC